MLATRRERKSTTQLDIDQNLLQIHTSTIGESKTNLSICFRIADEANNDLRYRVVNIKKHLNTDDESKVISPMEF